MTENERDCACKVKRYEYVLAFGALRWVACAPLGVWVYERAAFWKRCEITSAFPDKATERNARTCAWLYATLG